MSADQQRKHPITQHDFVRQVAHHLDDPEQRLEFQAACDAAQSALTYFLCSQNRFEQLQRIHCTGGSGAKEGGDSVTQAWEHYQRASAEYSRVTEKFKKSIKRLDLAVMDRLLLNKRDNP
jgi:hypothetical protein